MRGDAPLYADGDGGFLNGLLRAFLLSLEEAVHAIHRLVAAWAEWYFRLAAAVGARFFAYSVTFAAVFLNAQHDAAVGATLRSISETSAGVKLLFSC